MVCTIIARLKPTSGANLSAETPIIISWLYTYCTLGVYQAAAGTSLNTTDTGGFREASSSFASAPIVSAANAATESIAVIHPANSRLINLFFILVTPFSVSHTLLYLFILYKINLRLSINTPKYVQRFSRHTNDIFAHVLLVFFNFPCTKTDKQHACATYRSLFVRYAIPKNAFPFCVVISSTSCTVKPLKLAICSATRCTNSELVRTRPSASRSGSGVRYGLSVSIMMRSMGRPSMTRRAFFALP